MPPLPLDAFDLSEEDVGRRFAQARRRGTPGFPWPGVAPAAWRASLVEIERVVRSVLRPGTSGPAELRRPEGVEPEALAVAAYTSGLGPLLGLWVEQGRLDASPAGADLLALHLAHGRRRGAAMSRLRDDAVDALVAEGMEVVVLKGAHTGVAYFPEPAVRPAADIDLLVAGGGVEDAGSVLARLGWRRGVAQARPAKADWIPPGSADAPRSLHVVHADDPRRVELHGSLARDFFGVRTVDLPTEGALEPAVGVHPAARVLSPPLLVAYLALHASHEIHHLQLLRLVELARVIEVERGRGRLAPGAVADVLRRSDALRFALPALALTDKLLPGAVEETLLDAARHAAPRRMVRWVDRLTPAGAQRLEGVSLDERFVWCRGGGEHARRALSLLLPRKARGSARPPLRAVGDRVLGLLGGRVRLRGSDPALGDRATS